LQWPAMQLDSDTVRKTDFFVFSQVQALYEVSR